MNNELGRNTAPREENKQHPLDRYTVQSSNAASEQKNESPYFKSQAPSITLPKGGGALKGIDEKFTVNAVNGTAALEVALPLTPGRSGFTPSLSLSYNSGSGNGEFGLGWGLSLPSIQRKTDKQLPRYDDAHESDVFLLAGAEDLVHETDITGGTYTVRRYRPRIEGLFARIEYIREAGNTKGWWKVTTKDNITTFYGLTEEARISDPANSTRIFKWLPQLVTDHKGNIQYYTYKQEDFDGVITFPDRVELFPHERNRLNYQEPCNNVYLKSVYYANLIPKSPDAYKPALPNLSNDRFLMQLVLDYGEHDQNDPQPDDNGMWACRKDAFSDFHAGFEIRTWRKCKRVLMFHHFDELRNGDPCLVRSLDMAYLHDGSDEFTEADYITSFTQKGYSYTGSAYCVKALPSMILEYEALQWDNTIKDVSPADAGNAPQGLTGNYQWIDLYGEGISGILTEQGTGLFYKQNLGDGHFTPAGSVAPKPSLQGLGNTLQWQDLDADGRRQLVSNDPMLLGYYELDDDNEWQAFKAFKSRVYVDWNSPFTKMLDLTGDGKPDLLITDNMVWAWFENKGTEGYEEGSRTTVVWDEEKGPRLLLHDEMQSIFLADMNGDGLTDLVRIKNGEVCYWANKGYGKFSAKVTMTNAPRFDHPDNFNPQYITLADISGTGAADILYLGKNNCTAWINLAGNAWSLPYYIHPLPSAEPYSKIGVMDFLGNGTGCIVWSSPLPRHAHAPMRYIDLMGGRKPHLLRSYMNGMGKKTELFYKSSTRFYLQDKQTAKPWATRLPFPVHCLSRVVTTDAVSETSHTQVYRYHHGYYDHEEREFRGFGMVEVKDTEYAVFYYEDENDSELDQPEVLTKTWYHTGAWLRENTLLHAFEKEYCALHPSIPVLSPQDILYLPSPLNPQEQREAHRAIKGMPLRREVYALDGTPSEEKPYTVTGYAYGVTLLQPRGDNRFAVLYPYRRQEVTYHCERVTDDPRISHELTLAVDEYGNVEESATVVYPRSAGKTSGMAAVDTEQDKMHITYTEHSYTNDVLNDAQHYRLRLPYRSRSYELLGISLSSISGLWSCEELRLDYALCSEIAFTTPFTGAQKKRLLSETRSLYYDNTATDELPLGTIEALGLPYEQYTLAFAEDMLAAAAANPDTVYDGRVGDMELSEGGYVQLPSDSRRWLPSGVVQYDGPFFLPYRYTDPWGNVTEVEYSSDANAVNYYLAPMGVTDALDNETAIEAMDWRCLQPARIRDMNGNYADILYDALCMPVAVALKGKDNGTEGDDLTGIEPESTTDMVDQALFWSDPAAIAPDLLQGATWRCVYDLTGGGGTRAAMIAREDHYAADSNPPLLIRFTYTDGLGRVAMHKAQCAPTTISSIVHKWIGSGKTVYNNKGNVVLQYEPYFSTTHAYDPAQQAAEKGVSPRMYYDPLGRLYKTVMPDKSFTETEWTPWVQTTYDANDTVPDSGWLDDRVGTGIYAGIPEETDAKDKALAHADTPTLVHFDTLARPFYTVQYTDAVTAIESYVELDAQGNRIAVHDARGLTPLAYRYNYLKNPCRTVSADSGTQYLLTDVAGQPVYSRDADDREFHLVYDALRRPLEKYMDDVLFEARVYGEGQTNPQDDNLCGQLYRSYNGGGMQQISLYDFKGNPLETVQKLLSDATLQDVDLDTALLGTEAFTTTITYDALNRPITQTDPGNNTTEYTYDEGGLLKTVELNSTAYVQDIHYDAKGQREAIWYGNGTKTSYTHDEFTFRLRRLLTVKLSTNDILQDLNYYYDPVGNITAIRDDAQQTIFYANTIISPTREFTYDALYRLTEAKGREQIGTASFGSDDNYHDAAWMAALGSDAAQRYTQTYTYDEVGNITELQHSAGTGSYTRTYDYAAGNRLLNTAVGILTYSYTHDARGNMTAMPHLSAMDWNSQNHLSHITKGTNDAYYQYSNGQRIRKYVDKGSIKEERIYFGSYELYRKFDSSNTLIIERQTIHISDDTGRIAMLEVRTHGNAGDDNNTAATLTRYVYSNHLQSASLELDDSAEIISYEEYHPYGTTAYQAFDATINAVAKRYRYTGKERDEESGLYYHGARYYIPWLCRWCAVDAKQSKMPTWSSYNYGFCNPVKWTDSTGMQPDEPPMKRYTFQSPNGAQQTVGENIFPNADASMIYNFGGESKTWDYGIWNDANQIYDLLSFDTQNLLTPLAPSSQNENPLLSFPLAETGELSNRYGNYLEKRLNYDANLFSDYNATKERWSAKQLDGLTAKSLLFKSVGEIIGGVSFVLDAKDFVISAKQGMDNSGNAKQPLFLMFDGGLSGMLVSEKVSEYETMLFNLSLKKGYEPTANFFNNSNLYQTIGLDYAFTTQQNAAKYSKEGVDISTESGIGNIKNYSKIPLNIPQSDSFNSLLIFQKESIYKPTKNFIWLSIPQKN